MKNKVGRPTKYNELTVDKALAYIDFCSREATELPTVEGLALALEIDTDTVTEWEHKYPEFSVTIKQLRDKQKMQLMNDGMYGGKEVNSTMAIFLLKVNHGMIETSHTDITTGGEKLAPNVTINTTDH